KAPTVWDIARSFRDRSVRNLASGDLGTHRVGARSDACPKPLVRERECNVSELTAATRRPPPSSPPSTSAALAALAAVLSLALRVAGAAAARRLLAVLL